MQSRGKDALTALCHDSGVRKTDQKSVNGIHGQGKKALDVYCNEVGPLESLPRLEYRGGLKTHLRRETRMGEGSVALL
jgi:hypothetical protein